MRAGAWKVALGAGVVALLASGCGWGQFGFSSARTNFNDGETGLTVAKLGSLDFPWFNHPSPNNWGANAPILDGDRLFVTQGAALTAYDTANGHVVWTYALPNVLNGDGSLEDPALVGGRVVAVFNRTPANPGSATFGLVSVNPADGTGTEIDLGAGHPTGTPAVYGGDAYVTTEPTVGQPSTVESMNTAWRGAISDTRLGPTNPMVLGGRVYVSSGYSVDAFDPTTCTPGTIAGTCKPLWSRDLKLSGEANPGHSKTPVGLSADTIAVRTLYGEVWVLDAATGAVRWRTTGVSGSDGVSVARGVMYVVSHGNLLAFDANGCGAATCAPVWTGLNAGRDAAAVIAADVVYTSDRGDLRAFNANGCGAATCSEVWNAHISTNSDITWAIVYQSRIYVTSDDGTVAALKMYP